MKIPKVSYKPKPPSRSGLIGGGRGWQNGLHCAQDPTSGYNTNIAIKSIHNIFSSLHQKLGKRVDFDNKGRSTEQHTYFFLAR